MDMSGALLIAVVDDPGFLLAPQVFPGALANGHGSPSIRGWSPPLGSPDAHVLRGHRYIARQLQLRPRAAAEVVHQLAKVHPRPRAATWRSRGGRWALSL